MFIALESSPRPPSRPLLSSLFSLFIGRAELFRLISILFLGLLLHFEASLSLFLPSSLSFEQDSTFSHYHHRELDFYSLIYKMGNLVWHEYSRYVSLTASVCEWRADFWAYVTDIAELKTLYGLASGDSSIASSSGTLLVELCVVQEDCSTPNTRLPVAIADISTNRPSANDAIFITLIVKAPIIQILTMLTAFSMIALEYPLPQLKGTAINRNIVVRIVMLIMQAFMAILFYQVSRFLKYRGSIFSCGSAGNKWGNMVSHRRRLLRACSIPRGEDDGSERE